VLEKEIAQLVEQRNQLGLFKMKEKKALQEKIDALNDEQQTIQDRIETAVAAVKGKKARWNRGLTQSKKNWQKPARKQCSLFHMSARASQRCEALVFFVLHAKLR
jgi:hypothetical protein